MLSEIGGFGGLFAIDKKKYSDPVLVSSVDGVGTKLKVAFEMNLHSHHRRGPGEPLRERHRRAGRGSACSSWTTWPPASSSPTFAEKVVEGIADACKHNGCALIGGETAEMPGFYPDGEYDLAGFIVGVVDREKIITGKDVQIGDIMLGLPSNGLHTNGYSLARKLLFEVAHYSPETYVNEIKNKVGNELMRTHKSYWPALQEADRRRNASRRWRTSPAAASPKTCRACCRAARRRSIELGTWPVLPIFEHLQNWATSRRTKCCAPSTWAWACCWWFRPKKFKKAQIVLERVGEKAYTVGRIVKGERKVMYS